MTSTMTTNLFFFVLLISIILTIRNPNGASQSNASPSSIPRILQQQGGDDYSFPSRNGLSYDFYADKCQDAEKIVWDVTAQILVGHRDTPAALLRLLFHDCFIQGCDASVILDDSNGNHNYSIERQAIPNRTLRGFDKIDMIKEELEKVCPGVVSCADILVLATRNAVALSGGPFFPVFTGRRDSTRSYFEEALAGIPRPDANINETLHSFALRGFDERETVSLLGSHNIGKISCEFIRGRLNNFKGTGKPDPSLDPAFLTTMRQNCNNDSSPTTNRRKLMTGMSYNQRLSTEVSNGAGFNTHYYQSLINKRGLLFSDQQLMAEERTAALVRNYASDDGTTFRMDFAKAMVKMSNLNVLTGSQGVVRLNCSRPLATEKNSEW